MISVELWRARIGLFNGKRYSGFLSSLFSSCLPFKFHRRRKRNATQEKPSTASQLSLLAACNSSTDPSPAVTQLLPSSASLSPPSSACNSKSITSPDELSAVVILPQQSLLSSFSFSWSSFLPTSFPCGLLSSCLLREALVRLVLLIAIISQVLIISGDVETNPGPLASDRPSYNQLLNLKNADGSNIKVIQCITSLEQWQCTDFAHMLLKDDVLVSKYEKEVKEKDKFVRETLKNWLSRNDDDCNDSAALRTWAALAECVTDAGLPGTLTKAINDACPPAAINNPQTEDEDLDSAPLAKKSKHSDTSEDKPEELLVPSSSNNVVVLPQYSHSKVLDLKQPLPFHFETVIANSQTLRKRLRFTDTNSFLSDDWYTRLTMSQCEEIEQGRKEEMKWKRQKLQAFQSKMIAIFQQQQRKLERSSQQTSSTVFSSSKEHDLNPLDEFKSYLKHVYKHKMHATYFEEPSLKHYLPFNLFMCCVCNPFEMSQSCRLREDEESISLRLHNYEPGEKSCRLRIGEIGRSRPFSTNTILIEGAPGVGKSALALEICRKWVSGELLQDWSIVIIIQLCNQQVREAKLLSDFLYYPDQALRGKICQDLVTSEGKQVIFIVDDLDQLNEQQLPPQNSVYQQLVDKSLLPSATLMILSNVNVQQCQHTSQHIQVSCFTKETIDLYITSACSGDNNAELLATFKSYISSHPYIYNLMHIPAQCVMITDLYRLHWNNGDREFSPNTLTELYTDLVRTLLLRYLSCHHEYSQRKWVIKEFTDLPDKAKESFMALAQLAAKGIEERKYVFDEPMDFETLGMMQKVEEVYPGRESSESYSFLNLTLQEYLAAYYCSQQDSVERLQMILQSKNPLACFLFSYCHEFDKYPHPQEYLHRAVLLFKVGLTKLHGLDVQAIFETFENNVPTQSLSAMHLLYETQAPDLIRLATFLPDIPVRSTSNLDMLLVPKPHTPLDLFVTGYCIPHSNRSWLLDTTTFAIDKLFHSQLGEEYMKPLSIDERKKVLLSVVHFKALSAGLDISSDQYCSIGHIKRLIVWGNNIQWLHLLHPHTQKVTELFIQSVLPLEEKEYSKFPLFYPLLNKVFVNGILQKGFLPLLQIIPSMNSLEKLYLWFEIRSDNMDDISAIYKQLQTCPVRHEITAYNNSSDFPSYLLTISPNLEALQLFRLTLTPHLTQCEVSSLRILKINSCKIHDDACTALIHFLQSTQCVLEGFLLCTPDSDYRDRCSIPDKLVEAIGSSCTLKWCTIKGRDDSFVQHLVAGLKESKSRSCLLKALTVQCKYHAQRKVNCEHCNELINVVNEHNTIRLLQLSSSFKEFVGNCNIHDCLNIEYV